MSNHSLQQFEFSGLQVRATIIDGNPWFIAKDVCEILGLVNSAKATSQLDPDEVTKSYAVDTKGRKQSMSFVNESGLYSLIMRSNKTETKAFRKWVTSEVLPSIRKTGNYTLPQSVTHEPEVLAPVPTGEPSDWLSGLKELAALTPKAIDAKVEVAKTQILEEVTQRIEHLDRKIGSLPINSEQVWYIKKGVGEIVRLRAAVKEKRRMWGQVYQDAFDVAHVGKLAFMTQEQYPRVKAWLDAEIERLRKLDETGLFKAS